MTNNCTLCGKPLDDFKINVDLTVSAQRLTDAGVWEAISNTNINSREILCNECFDKFVATFKEFNK